MNVTRNEDDTLTVAFTTDEFAMFQQAIASGVFQGGTPEGALEGYLQGALAQMTTSIKRELVEEARRRLPACTVEQLTTLLASLPASP